MKKYDLIGIKDAAFKLPCHYITVDELLREYEHYIQNVRENDLILPKLKTADLREIEKVPVFKNEARGMLVIKAIKEILIKNNINSNDISLIIDFSTTSRDVNGISLCYKVQSEIRADNTLTLSIGNGSCVSFHLALKIAVSMMKEDENIKYALLFAEDRVVGRRINIPSNVLGDGASAVLLERDNHEAVIGDIQYISIGKYHDVLGINHWEENNFNVNKFEQYIIPVHYKVILDLTNTVLKRNNLSIKDIDLVLYQNMCLNDYSGLIGMLGIKPCQVFTDGLRGKGHIFGSDLVINYCLAKEQTLIDRGKNILLISSGAGFSWGVTLVQPFANRHVIFTSHQPN